MESSQVVFGSFTFPNLPSHIKITRKRRWAALARNGGGNVMQNMGNDIPVYEVSGFFYGSAAYANLNALQAVFNNGADSFSSGQTGPVSVYPHSLQIEVPPSCDMAKYKLVLWGHVKAGGGI